MIVVPHATAAAVVDRLPGAGRVASLRRCDPRVAGSSLMLMMMTIGWNCIGDGGRGLLHIGLLLLLLLLVMLLLLAGLIDCLQGPRPPRERGMLLQLQLLLLRVLVPARVLVAHHEVSAVQHYGRGHERPRLWRRLLLLRTASADARGAADAVLAAARPPRDGRDGRGWGHLLLLLLSSRNVSERCWRRRRRRHRVNRAAVVVGVALMMMMMMMARGGTVQDGPTEFDSGN